MTAPVLAVETPAGRMYQHPRSGVLAPSVTSVIEAGVGKPQLVGWAAGMAAKYAVANWTELDGFTDQVKVEEIRHAHSRYAEERGAVGDSVHEMIDSWQKGKPFLPETIVRPYASQFTNFMFDIRPSFIENEVTIWSHQHGYAGTADWIAEIGGDIFYGDNKTGKRVYPEVGLQLAALAGADVILRPDGTEDEMPGKPEDRRLAALHIRPRSWKFIEVTEQAACFDAFLAARAIWAWKRLEVLSHV